MDLVIIYGPPAAGKLTVAKELQKLTGYKLHHNHLAFDLVNSVLDFEQGNFWELINKFRMETIEAAAENGVKGVIITFCYAKGDDDKNLERVVRRLKKHRVTFRFVHLHCHRQALLKRVKEESRKPYGKLKDTAGLKRTLQQYDYFTPYPHPNTLQIDNTDVPPKKAAQLIRTHFKL